MSAARIVPAGAATALAAGWRAGRARAALVVGAFDVLAVAHARTVASARRSADRVLVAVWDDGEARRRLGAGRPLLAAGERARLAAALRGVEAVVIVDRDGLAALEGSLGPGIDADRDAPDPVARVDVRREPGGAR